MPRTERASLARAALLGRCPRCGEGRIFNGLLDIKPTCASCGLDLSAHDAGDGPAVAGVFLIGAAAVIAALIVDSRYRPPVWVHALIWPALVLGGALFVMRTAKALLLALQWRHRQ
ncbi:MAG: DUF983 domain-containing protein [Pseudomonadota bacterium]